MGLGTRLPTHIHTYTHTHTHCVSANTRFSLVGDDNSKIDNLHIGNVSAEIRCNNVCTAHPHTCMNNQRTTSPL